MGFEQLKERIIDIIDQEIVFDVFAVFLSTILRMKIADTKHTKTHKRGVNSHWQIGH